MNVRAADGVYIKGEVKTIAAKEITSLEKQHKQKEAKSRFVIEGLGEEFAVRVEEVRGSKYVDRLKRLFTHKRLWIEDTKGKRQVDVNIRSLARLHLTLKQIRGANDLAELIDVHLREKGDFIKELASRPIPPKVKASTFIETAHRHFSSGNIVMRAATSGGGLAVMKPGSGPLASGSVTSVFAATDLYTGEELVVKRAHEKIDTYTGKKITSNDSFASDGYRSNQVYQRLHPDGTTAKIPGVWCNPHAVSTLGRGKAKEQVYVELRAGGDLLDGVGTVESPGPLVLLTGRQILYGFLAPLEGLAILHAKDVVHGDLKLENFIFFGDQFFITDFGGSSLYNQETHAVIEGKDGRVDNITTHLYTMATASMVNKIEMDALQDLDPTKEEDRTEIKERNKARDVADYALSMVEFLTRPDQNHPFVSQEWQPDYPLSVWGKEPKENILSAFSWCDAQGQLGLEDHQYEEFVDILSDMIKYDPEDYTARLKAHQALERYREFVQGVYPP